MFDNFRVLDRKRRRALLAVLAALTMAITGCNSDDPVESVSGVSTGVLYEGQPGNNDVANAPSGRNRRMAGHDYPAFRASEPAITAP